MLIEARLMQFRAGVPQQVPERHVGLRLLELVSGLGAWGLAIALMIRSELGLGPWDAFHVGLHLQTGLSVGVANIATGAFIVGVTLALRVRPGLAIVLNTILIGVFVDLLLPVVPTAPTVWAGVAYFLGGLLTAGLATGLYIGAGFGQGPRDALMLAMHERAGWSVQRARTVLEASVLVAGWLMGARIGIGTLLYALAIGPVVQWGLRLFARPSATAVGDDSSSDPPAARRLRRAA